MGGSLSDISSYMLNKGVLKGNINMTADKIDLNEWMGNVPTGTTVSSAPTAPFVVPANLEIIVAAKAAEVEYDKVNYRNVHGTLLVKDETVTEAIVVE